MLKALQSASDSLVSDNVKIKTADVSNPGIPPSSLMTFLRKVGKYYCLAKYFAMRSILQVLSL